MPRPAPFLLAAILLGACASSSGEEREMLEVDTTRDSNPPPLGPVEGTLVRTARDVAFDEVVEDLASADVVYVGETHTEAGHHAAQLRVVEALWHRGRLHAVGMEMFHRLPHVQEALDAYVEGRISEEEMLDRTEWKKRWGFPFELYRPILRFARDKRLPVVALNVPDEIRRKVSQGGLDALDEDERRALPALAGVGEEDAYQAFVRASYEGHLPEGAEPDEAKFQRFLLVMRLWDETMADSVVQWFRTAPPGAQMVVLAGNGHIANRWGIPSRVHQRNGRSYRIVVPVGPEHEPQPGDYARRYADYLWVTTPSGSS